MRLKHEKPDTRYQGNDNDITSSRSTTSVKVLRKFPPLLYLGSGLALALVLSVAMVALYFSDKQKEEEKWIERTYIVLNAVASLQQEVTDLIRARETAVQSENFPDHPADRAQTADLLRKTTALTDLVQDNKPQKARAQMISTHVSNLLNIQQTGSEPSAFTQRRSIEQQKTLEAIRTTIDTVKKSEQSLLKERIRENGRLRERTSISVITGVLLILAIVSFLIYLVLTEFGKEMRAYEKEKDISTLKSNFVSLASHEFRTPLSSVLLSVNLIEKYNGTQDRENIIKHCQKIKNSINNLNGILEDFLSLEKLNTGKVKPVYTSFNLQELCSDIVEDLQTIVKPGQALRYEAEGGSEVSGLDEHLIRNSIINLISNAIKYAGKDAHILLKTMVDSGQIIIAVNDDGVGIGEKDMKNLFKPFFRIKQDGSIPGTGLGLNIVLRYVQLMNGTMTLTSKPGEGACFTMNFVQG
ncbi:hypothetical protein BEL04_06945 [Mucilaginibacter sp. PPCGB 2223]|uniref:sensor histidine kinase n=1 Tax=Mucilaginibacter sp. PPCGB 2223 TaxID=1886027 RepID=UPI0008260238|nr:HAMP domain-containing sensor histidine kinase [Mucilaginibacter sp. PPCGB 2223]OCX54006.1 hypothetical protein BEL04_06945 [Mucilaginibacter sp. PPCGB 2223]